ncbi:hypothetical protein JOM56_002516 [Amanita muscaria]|uniref:Uncharacterized protein n=1 Tax=Amanita muscaria (strain Koide BX008) TaxID=946122 RepID=A0A0C2SYZ1_AMAMK|nr:hypothetical protein M378DRAFT_8217 [Amanita muscaria Koide BX008]
MHIKVFATIVFTCLVGIASASPVPINAPLDEISRSLPVEREASPEPAPEPEPICRWNCI